MLLKLLLKIAQQCYNLTTKCEFSKFKGDDYYKD